VSAPAASVRVAVWFGLTMAAFEASFVSASEGADTIRTTVTPYPMAPGEVLNRDYGPVTVDREQVSVVACKDAAYAHFGFQGKIQVTITTREPIRRFNLSPHSCRIPARAEGPQLSFTLDRPRKLVVQVNELPLLFVFADPIETNVPMPGSPGVLLVTDFGADPMGVKPATAALQKALEATALLNGGKGGTLVFPPGRYLTGTLFPRDNSTLYLAPGALVQGTLDKADYPTSAAGEHLLFLRNVTNVVVRGRGVFDGNGTQLRARHGLRNRVIGMLDCRDVLVEGVLLSDSGSWNTHVIRSDGVALRNIKILCNVNLGNTDAMDPDSVQRMTIEDSFAYSGDDSVAVKSTGRAGDPRPVADLVVRSNVFWTRKSALKLGTESRGPSFRNILFQQNDVVHADRALVIYNYDGTVCEDIRFVDNRAEVIGGDRDEKLIHMEITNRSGRGQIRNVLVRNFLAEQFSAKDSVINGLDTLHRVSDVVIENFVVGGRPRASLEDAHIQVNAYAGPITFPVPKRAAAPAGR
jgi:hypothetical protein